MSDHRARSRIDLPLVLAVSLAGLGLLWVLLALPSLEASANWAQDFVAYRSASLRLADEGTLYASVSLVGDFEPEAQNLYLYPPPLGIAMAPFSAIDPSVGATAWYLLHVVVLAATCALMPVRGQTRLLVFGLAALSFAVLRDLTMGNVSVLLLLPLVLGWRWLDRPAGSIALAVAASVRVTFGVYLMWFLIRRAWWPLLWMAAAGGVLILLSLPFVGIGGYLDYLTLVSNVSGTTDLVQNRHLTVTALSLGVAADMAWLILIPTYILALGAVIYSRRRDREVGFMVTAAAALLLAPLIWDHYLSITLLTAAFLAQRGRPWALVLPLLSWLPPALLPFVAIATLLLPFLARDPESPEADAVGMDTTSRSAGVPA